MIVALSDEAALRQQPMKHVVSYSGGVCSFWAAHRVIERHGFENVTLLFADTLIEDEDLYAFNDAAENVLGVPITRIADGRNPWQVFIDESYIGNSRTDPCSKILKRQLIWRWIEQNCDPKNTTIHLGMDWTEAERLERVRGRKPAWTITAPMTEVPLWSKDRMIAELKPLGLSVPRLYDMGFPHNNCGGFCVKAGQAQFALLLRQFPERYYWHEKQEQEARKKIGDYAVLRDRSGGQSKPWTLQNFRIWIESGKPFDRHEWGGCGCAVDF